MEGDGADGATAGTTGGTTGPGTGKVGKLLVSSSGLRGVACTIDGTMAGGTTRGDPVVPATTTGTTGGPNHVHLIQSSPLVLFCHLHVCNLCVNFCTEVVPAAAT
jgi:hypothetical protein